MNNPKLKIIKQNHILSKDNRARSHAYHRENTHFNNPNTLILEIKVKAIIIYNNMTNSMINKMDSNKQDIM